MNPRHPMAEGIRRMVAQWLAAGGNPFLALRRAAAARERLVRFANKNPHTGLPSSGPRRPAGSKIARRAHQQKIGLR